MSSAIELDDLSTVKNSEYDADSDASSHAPTAQDGRVDSAVAVWSWTAASILGVWSAVLTLLPRLLLFAAEESQTLTPLESFLALHFGILLAGTTLALVLHIPSPHPVPVRAREELPSHPLLVTLTSVTLPSAFLSYNTPGAGGLPVLYALCMGTIGVWGLWTITFAGTSLISKTGADKHTSSFIFGNKSAASVQKKRWKKEQKVKGR